MVKTFKTIKKDFNRYIATGAKSKIKIILFNQGFFFTAVYRLNNSLYQACKHIPVLRQLMGLHCLIWLKLSQIISGLSIPVNTQIGAGLFISHAGTIIINNNCIIGSNCNIGPEVVIGFGIKNGNAGYPTIGDRVFIGPGAKIFGPITIGNDVMIGANAVVNGDIPDMAVAVGIPAKVINYKGSREYIKFN